MPEHPHRQPGKDQEEQETRPVWWEPLRCRDGRDDRLLQSFVALYRKHPGQDTCLS